MLDDRKIPTARRLAAALGLLAVLGGCARSGPQALGLEEKFTRWTRYEAEPGATHFSALDQIDRTNVGQLQVAWSYEGGAGGFNPIVIDTIMYVFARNGSALAALHAATGRELWVHTPEGSGGVGRRGVMYWESDDRSDRRLYITRNNHVHAIDAMTGRPIPSFGVDGRADLRQGITSREHAAIIATPSSPGTVWEDVLIFGSGPGEAYTAGPGDIRAFDAVTGEFLWVFHTIPHPGEYGYETWPEDAWTRVGGTNAWGGLSVDEARGIVYVPLGSASYDFYGADRTGDNLFANSLVALDIRTGKRLWHYQTVHHDLWDYDLTATPTLLTVQHGGRMVDVVALAAKTGYLFVFDRVTGEPLWPIEERPVPTSDMPGEVTSPTQPHPTWPRPFAVQSFSEADINPYLPAEERDSVLKRLRGIKNLQETLFQPPSTQPTMQMPGNSGGANWGSTGGDPRDGSFYVVTKNLPTVLQLERILPGVFGTGTTQADRGQFTYQQNCQACHQPDFQGTPPLIPSLVGVTDRLTPEQFRTVVQEGRGNMPAFRDLSNQEIGAIMTYIANPALASPPRRRGSRRGVEAPCRAARTPARSATRRGTATSR